ncbi:MAG: ferritin-like domain-containing protein [Actinomycetota bacterium]|nr:ferritin-like domain-containing protein [Actinomycetota bacterium]
MVTPEPESQPVGARRTVPSGQLPSVRVDEARTKLVALLQLAHSGELAAAFAYTGHAASVKNPVERTRIESIKAEEIDHRARVRAMMDTLGVEPDAKRERRLRRIGKTISAFCRVGGWFGPMYGAARLERKNIGEYERAAGYAVDAGYPEFLDDLIDMSEVEWEHEKFFREKCESHWLWKVFPSWPAPPPKDDIRAGVLAATQ